jgi:Class II flagellar assembly regulator
MRIERAGGAGAVAPGNTVRRSSGDGFAVSEQDGAQRPAANAGVRSIGGIEVLIALQGAEEPGERRRRAIARGRTALDALDELKIGLLAGGLDGSTVPRLKAAVSGLKDDTGDPTLDAVLAEIDLRVEVELAKMAAAPIT